MPRFYLCSPVEQQISSVLEFSWLHLPRDGETHVKRLVQGQRESQRERECVRRGFPSAAHIWKFSDRPPPPSPLPPPADLQYLQLNSKQCMCRIKEAELFANLSQTASENCHKCANSFSNNCINNSFNAFNNMIVVPLDSSRIYSR